MKGKKDGRLAYYESAKKQIAETAKSQEEYERRVRALARKLRI